jgi:lipoprotein signal peptidase
MSSSLLVVVCIAIIVLIGITIVLIKKRNSKNVLIALILFLIFGAIFLHGVSFRL